MTPTTDSPTRTADPAAQADAYHGGVRRLPSSEPEPGAPRAEAPVPARPVAARAVPARPAPTRPSPAPEPDVPVPARRAAHALIVMALEVVDRKRAPQHTRGAFPSHLTEMLRTLARDGVPGRDLGAARIHRLHIHPADPGAPRTDESGEAEGVEYEVCATYARGPRLFAVAARIRVRPRGASCVALRLV